MFIIRLTVTYPTAVKPKVAAKLPKPKIFPFCLAFALILSFFSWGSFRQTFLALRPKKMLNILDTGLARAMSKG